MSEGLSGTEVGKEIAEHAKHSSGHKCAPAARPHPLDRGGGSDGLDREVVPEGLGEAVQLNGTCHGRVSIHHNARLLFR
jgi:hypothetical protein